MILKANHTLDGHFEYLGDDMYMYNHLSWKDKDGGEYFMLNKISEEIKLVDKDDRTLITSTRMKTGFDNKLKYDKSNKYSVIVFLRSSLELDDFDPNNIIGLDKIYNIVRYFLVESKVFESSVWTSITNICPFCKRDKDPGVCWWCCN